MADDPHNTSDISDQPELENKEDAATAAAREELKQTVISERADKMPSAATPASDKDPVRTKTPELEVSDKQEDSLKDQVSSPKKKRAHDQVDEPVEAGEGLAEAEGTVAAANGIAAAGRTARSEPEKKRARDEPLKDGEQDSKEPLSAKSEATSSTDGDKSKNSEKEKEKEPKSATSSDAFAKSGFSKLASSSTSPFGALGASSKSVFGGASGSQSPFGTLGAKAAAKPATPTLSFGGGDKAGSASPFASLNGQSKGFGSAFGSGFGGVFAGPKLSGFGQPGEVLKNDKPARPFGAPESDAEDDSNAEDDVDEEGGTEEAEKEKTEAEKEESKPAAPAEDKKKPKLQKVVVDDGEAGEVTILQVRAKMFALDKTKDKEGKEELAWKERGVGNLKINVPEDCIEVNETGAPIPDSFDASVLETDEDDEEQGADKHPKVVRLILRQDSTLRVILNTALMGHMEFQEKTTLKATNVLFTAFDDGGKPVSVQMKMNPANAKAFLDRVELIKRELMS